MKKGKKSKINFKHLFKKIIASFKEKIDGFNKLSNKVKLVILIWFIVFVLLIAFIIVGNANRKHNEDYANIEAKITQAMEDYAKKNNIYATENNPIVFDTSAFILDEEAFGDKKCIGYSVVYNSDSVDDKVEYTVKTYINCKDYTTKGYKENR